MRISGLPVQNNQVNTRILRPIDFESEAGTQDSLMEWRQNLRAERSRTEMLTTADIKKKWSTNWALYGRYLEARMM